MKRVDLFEFEDQSWFPKFIRESMTKILVVMNRFIGADRAIAQILIERYRQNPYTVIVDLGSGFGGPMPDVRKIIAADSTVEEPHLILTDLYPNKGAIAKYSRIKGIEYSEQSVNAMNLENAPEGVKTMINSFHHMDPDQARKILESAKNNGETLLIFEMAENKIPFIIWLVFLPLGLLVVFFMALVFTPMTNPLKWQQLLFTYLIPIIPICYAWDGQASLPRIYASTDLDELLVGLEDEEYQWTRGYGTGKNGKKVGQYLLGHPRVNI